MKACQARLRKLDIIRAHLDAIEQQVRAAQQAMREHKRRPKMDRQGGTKSLDSIVELMADPDAAG